MTQLFDCGMLVVNGKREKANMANIIKKRREVGAVCHICYSPDYKQVAPYDKGGKPNFICNSCGARWQYGYSGGKYAKLAKGEKQC